MNIVIKGKHLKENQALEDYAREKTAKFYHFESKIIKVEIELRAEVGHKGKESDFIADINVKVPGNTFKVTDYERDMYKAIDKATRRMNEVLRREHDKKQTRLKKHFNRIRQIDFGQALRSINKKIFRTKS